MKGLVFVLLALCACGETRTNRVDRTESFLEFNEERQIPIHAKSTNFALLTQLWEDASGEAHLIRMNYFSSNPNYLFINSLNDSTLDLTLEFENEGPHGVGNVTEFYFHSYDSIFLIDRYQYRVSLADSSGRVLQSYRIKHSSGNRPDENSVLPWSSSKSRIFKVGNALYIPVIPDVDPFLTGYQKENLLVELDLISGECSSLLGFPNSYKSGEFFGGPEQIIPSISPYKALGQYLVSFPLSDSIFLLDIQTKKMKPFQWMGSRLREDLNFIDFTERQTDRGKAFQLGTDFYFSVNYDPIRKEIWRVFYKKYTEESISKMLDNQSGGPNQKTLLRISENNTRLEEIEIPLNSKLNPYDLMVLKDGFFVSFDSLEDRLIFKKITIRN
ncbi:DUF4221 family protein [Algoriphagus sp.]|uniref:DUF4221 family protein n=1 Tax=Algoriphagus sp. TaxID=1872435 RepID=UPI00260AADF4|nr:DUF4221 family protein [Algoriphagus sp.]